MDPEIAPTSVLRSQCVMTHLDTQAHANSVAETVVDHPAVQVISAHAVKQLFSTLLCATANAQML